MSYETVMQWCMICAQVECFMVLCGERNIKEMKVQCVCMCVAVSA